MTANKDGPKLIPTALDYSRRLLDAEEKRFLSHIRKHGWTGTYVFGGDHGPPSFFYTTGFWLTGFPELIIFSMELEHAHRLAWHLFEDVMAGKPPQIGVPTMFGILTPVGAAERNELLTWSHWFYQRKEFEAVQFSCSETNIETSSGN